MKFTDVALYAKNFPVYKKSIKKVFPILEKTDISSNFPEGWHNEEVIAALKNKEAEYIQTTGTSYDRMMLIRPPFFLMK